VFRHLKPRKHPTYLHILIWLALRTPWNRKKNQSHGSVHIEDVTHEREGPALQEEAPVGPPHTTVSEAEESLQNLDLRAQLRKKREMGPLINSYGSIISTQSSQYAMKKKKSQASLEVKNFNNLKGERAVSTEPLFRSLPSPKPHHILSLFNDVFGFIFPNQMPIF